MNLYCRLLFSFVILQSLLLYSFAGKNIDFAHEQITNETRPYQLQIKRLVCLDTPYVETVLHECRAILRRNQPSLLRIVLHVPKQYDYVLIRYQLHYRYNTYQPFLIDGEGEACALKKQSKTDLLLHYVYRVMKEMVPDINKTFIESTVFKEEYAPKSVPAGDYRMDIRLASKTNVTLLSLQCFAVVRRKGVLGSMLEW
uniref:Uncharacterized protein n=1 Tax=Anopheles epiroticus TaxID=199890 RepID=A0A9I3FGW4_9DIPT